MRELVRFIVGAGMMLAMSSAGAQRYDPNYPVCMEVADENGSRMECFFTSMEQCKQGAKGMPATCFNNPYYRPSALPAAEAAPAVDPRPTPSPALAKKKKR